MRIVLPNTRSNLDNRYGPVFFLAGPVQGGDDWQAKCCEEIEKHLPRFYAVLPCHYDDTHRLAQFSISKEFSDFPNQTIWERHYLWLASRQGCIIFWLPEESREHPRDDGEPYAMDTRGELGEWRGRMMAQQRRGEMIPRVVVGGESGFPGLNTIQRNFSYALEQNFPIYPTLAATVLSAMKMIQG